MEPRVRVLQHLRGGHAGTGVAAAAFLQQQGFEVVVAGAALANAPLDGSGLFEGS